MSVDGRVDLPPLGKQLTAALEQTGLEARRLGSARVGERLLQGLACRFWVIEVEKITGLGSENRRPQGMALGRGGCQGTGKQPCGLLGEAQRCPGLGGPVERSRLTFGAPGGFEASSGF
jgi:hypothetical protein